MNCLSTILGCTTLLCTLIANCHIHVQGMGDYCIPDQGITEIMPPRNALCCQRAAVDRRSRQPEGGIMHPEGGIISVSLREGVQ